MIFLRYRRYYLHLCAAEGSVPVATVWTVELKPRGMDERHLRIIRERFARSNESGVLRTIRVNYRDYGLDRATKEAVLSLFEKH